MKRFDQGWLLDWTDSVDACIDRIKYIHFSFIFLFSSPSIPVSLPLPPFLFLPLFLPYQCLIFSILNKLLYQIAGEQSMTVRL